jgi:predicted heme/steroid binding protein
MMRKIRIVLSLVIVMALLGIAGCSSDPAGTQETAAPSQEQSATPAATDTASDKTFTLDDLKTYDGQNGNPAYIAVDGVVYDVTNASGWKEGKHKGNTAGNDLTDAIANAPHGTGVLDNLPVVGKLE